MTIETALSLQCSKLNFSAKAMKFLISWCWASTTAFCDRVKWLCYFINDNICSGTDYRLIKWICRRVIQIPKSDMNIRSCAFGHLPITLGHLPITMNVVRETWTMAWGTIAWYIIPFLLNMASLRSKPTFNTGFYSALFSFRFPAKK